jgi:YVTN family beta-propeller protein
VTPLATATNKAGTPIKVGVYPSSIMITPNGKTAYVMGSTSVTPITLATGKAGAAIDITDGVSPWTALSPDGKTLYVLGLSAATPIDTATGKVGTSIEVGEYPGSIAVTPNGATVYVLENGNTLVAISTATDTVTQVADFSESPGYALAITPDSKTVYVATEAAGGAGAIFPVQTATGTVGSPITVGSYPWYETVTSNGKTLYVADSGTDTVTPIDTATGTAGTPIKVGTGPSWISITPNGKTAYVNSCATDSGGTFIPCIYP